MTSALAIIAAIGLAVSQPAGSTDQLIEQSIQAYQSGDLDRATRLAEQAVAAANGAGERFNALILYGDLRSEGSDHGAAYELYARAVELVETESPENTAALSMALSRQGSAALNMGRREEWLALGRRTSLLNRAEEEPIWRFGDMMRVRHRFSGLPCPANSEGFVRVELITYDSLGTDVACSYAIPDGPPMVMTVHAFHTGHTAEEAFEAARDGMLRNFSASHRIDEGTSALGGQTVHHAIHRQGETTAGVWTHQVRAWTIKLRLTHYGGLESDDLDAAARLVFSSLPDVIAHQDHCAVLTGAGVFEPADGMTSALGSALMSMTAGIEPDTVDALECFIGEANFQPAGGTVVVRVDAQGAPIDFRGYPRHSRAAYLQAVNDDTALNRILLEAGEDADGAAGDVRLPSRWQVRQVTPDRMAIYGQFTDTPSPEAFRQIVDEILAGDISPGAWISTQENGNLHVQLVEPPDDTPNPNK